MAQIHKIEVQTQTRSSPDRVFDIYKNKSYLMPKISPDKLQSIEVIEGDGISVGSVRLWTYVMGKVKTVTYLSFWGRIPIFKVKSMFLVCH